MKKFIPLLAFAGASLASAAAPYSAASVGYMIDTEEAYFSGRFGFNLSSYGDVKHGIEAEVGYVDAGESAVSFDLVPVTANYRLTSPLSNVLSVYIGGGTGFTYVKVGGFGVSDNDIAFTVQGFAGFEFKLNETVSVTTGARYFYIDEAELFGFTEEVGDDAVIEIGVRVAF